MAAAVRCFILRYLPPYQCDIGRRRSHPRLVLARKGVPFRKPRQAPGSLPVRSGSSPLSRPLMAPIDRAHSVS